MSSLWGVSTQTTQLRSSAAETGPSPTRVLPVGLGPEVASRSLSGVKDDLLWCQVRRDFRD